MAFDKEATKRKASKLSTQKDFEEFESFESKLFDLQFLI